MSTQRRGRGLAPSQTTTQDGSGLRQPSEASLDLPPEPKRWRIAISAVVFEGYFYGTWDEAMRLQNQLKERRDVFGNVFLRAEQKAQPTDYTTVEDAIASIELAVPVKQ